MNSGSMMKERILELLQGPGFVSGQKISEELGVSRTAVWKYINALRKEGYELESVTRRGYRLLQSPDVLTRERLAGLLKPDLLTGDLCCYDKVDSTNEEAKRKSKEDAPDRSLYVAEVQTRGKGRRGRRWQSPGGRDIFFSMLLKPDIPMESASMVTLVTAYAAVLTARKYAREDCYIKWPNDIVLHGKKICGILTEMSTEMNQISAVIVGVGVNLNRTDFEPEIQGMAGSILSESGHTINRGEFLRDFIKEFNRVYQEFLNKGDLSFMRRTYNSYLINVNRQVKIIGLASFGDITGTALGINDRGELLVRDTQGHIHEIRSGEVSVRGLYGYV